jgi:clan AA aspartic protease
MGLTEKVFKVKASYAMPNQIEVKFLIDSGAIFSLIPETELQKIGVLAYKTMDFYLADGTKITRKVGDAYFEYQGEGGAAPVVFGEEGDMPLLGATALEACTLILNPYRRELYLMNHITL